MNTALFLPMTWKLLTRIFAILAVVAPLQAADPASASPAVPANAAPAMGLSPIRVEDMKDEALARRLSLHIPIQALHGAKIDLKQFVIHVLFYDVLGSGEVVQTSADIKSKWMSGHPDWTTGDTEELVIEYRLPKPKTETRIRENRKYFGYLVRLYYQGRLQTATAEPARLLVQYPAPKEIDAEGSHDVIQKRFLEAEQAADEGEKLEKAGDHKGALAKVEKALALLEEVTTLDSDWQQNEVANHKERANAAVKRLAPLVGSALPPMHGGTAAPVAGEKVHVENGVTTAEGHAHFIYGLHSLTADTIRYDPTAQTADLTGNAEIREEIEGGVRLVAGDRISVTFGPGDAISVRGPHKTSVIPNKLKTPEEKRLDEVEAEGFFAFLKGGKLEKEGKIREAVQEMELADRKFEELKTISAVPDEDLTILRQRIAETLRRLRGKLEAGTR